MRVRPANGAASPAEGSLEVDLFRLEGEPIKPISSRKIQHALTYDVGRPADEERTRDPLRPHSRRRADRARRFGGIEAGFRNFEVVGFYGFLAPAGTPREAVDTLARAFRQVLEAPEVRGRMVQPGADPAYLDSDAFTKFLAAEMPRWVAAVRASGARAD